MKFGTTVVAISLLAVVGVAGAQGKPKVAHPSMAPMGKPMMRMMSKAEWQKMYDQAARMMEKKDTKSLFSYMTSDFVMMEGGKPMSTAASQAGMQKWMDMMKTVKASMTVTKVSQKGNMAMVTDNFRMGGMTKPDPKTHKSGMMVSSGTETATWVNMGGKWKMKKMVTTNEKMTMNGKPIKSNM